jgi:hypothetical protein
MCAVQVNWPAELPGRTHHVISLRETEYTTSGKHIDVCIFWLRFSELRKSHGLWEAVFAFISLLYLASLAIGYCI